MSCCARSYATLLHFLIHSRRASHPLQAIGACSFAVQFTSTASSKHHVLAPMDGCAELLLIHWMLNRQRQVGAPHLSEQAGNGSFLFGRHWLFALAALDLRVDLISACIQQFYGLILQLPHIAVKPQIGLISVDTFAGDQLRGF